MSDHKLPGEFVYDGCHYDSIVTSAKMLAGVKTLKLTSDDTIVTTYVKSGTTWMKLMTYLILHEGEMPDDLPLAVKRHLEFRFAGENEEDVLRSYEKLPAPRMFSSHVHFRFVENLVSENKVKFIVVMRNPKDALVSLFHFYRAAKPMGSFDGTWDEFFELFKEKCLWGGDFFDFNTAWWNNRDKENVFITSYEEMKRDREGVVRKVAKFLGKNLSEEVVQKVVHHTSFEEMKNNPLVNSEDIAKQGMMDFSKAKFMRKGVVGDWKTMFSSEQEQCIKQRCEEECKPIGLTFEDSM